MNKSLGVLGSSVDPTQIAATFQGLIVSFSAIIILLAGHRGINLVPAQIQDFAGQIGLIAGFGYMLFGLVRKLIVWLHDVYVQSRSSNLG